jgi:hypothetical protein
MIIDGGEMNNTGTVVGIVLVVVLVVLLFGGMGMMGFGMTLAPHASAASYSEFVKGLPARK